MNDQMWLEGLRAEYRYNLLCADLHARIRDLRTVMARQRAYRRRVIVELAVVGGFAGGVALLLWLW